MNLITNHKISSLCQYLLIRLRLKSMRIAVELFLSINRNRIVDYLAVHGQI